MSQTNLPDPLDSLDQLDPLDPLTADEFTATAQLLAAAHGVSAENRWRFAAIELVEPNKAVLAAFRAGGERPHRVSLVLCLDRTANATYRSRVDLTDATVLDFERVEGVQANFTVDEWEEADAALRANPDVIAALATRGITDLTQVFIDTWTYGASVMPERFADRRIGWADIWVKQVEGGNPYAGPVNGLHLVIDVNSMELLDIEDTFSVERPTIMGEYVPSRIPARLLEESTRPERKPLDIIQPEGPSFRRDGNRLTWQNWDLRVGFNYREGMTLHEVSYTDAGRKRSIAHRMSFAEMVVPYRDHSDDHFRRTAFDIGEWGLGFMTTSLELGCDCLGEIRYLDAVLHDSSGKPQPISQAICIHEEDNGLLYKHVDHDGGPEVRRMRRLVVSFHATVANYEYLVYWRFYEDGNIECEVRATGIMVVSHLPVGATPPHGTMIDQRTFAPFHQHFLVARLDLDIDGTENTVVSTHTEVEPMGPSNPLGLNLRQVNTALRTEAEGKQDYDWATQKAWKVTNPNLTNALGGNPSYKIVPGGAIPAMFSPDSPIFARAQAIGHTLWVTPNRDDERWPCGEFVNQSGPDTADLGLPTWTAANRNIENTDVVCWYTFGIHHITRPEEWPIMPVDIVSFWLKPVGFFDRSPVLDVAPTPSHCASNSDPAVHGCGCGGSCGCK